MMCRHVPAGSRHFDPPGFSGFQIENSDFPGLAAPPNFGLSIEP